MRKMAIIALFTSLLLSGSLPLSKEKSELLRLQREKVKQDISIGVQNWVSPLSLSASATKDKNELNSQSESKSVDLIWNQDIFRSGGIDYDIQSAKDIGAVNMLGIDISEANYLKQIYMQKTEIDRDTLAYEQQKLTLKNSDINFIIIQAKYRAGNTDIVDLNRAAIDRDSARTKLIITKNSLRSEHFKLKKLIGNFSIKKIKLPNIPLLTEEVYVKNNLELLKYRAEDRSNNTNLQLVKSSYLPKLTFNASAGYGNYKNNVVGYDGDSYSYGLSFSIPFDINRNSTVESSRLAYLQSKEARIDRRRELEQEYETHINNMADYREKISVASSTLKMYHDLYDFTNQQYKAGFKSLYDLESLGNSLEIQKIEKKIQQYNILLEKISLYFDIRH